jgi:hypothetical protein
MKRDDDDERMKQYNKYLEMKEMEDYEWRVRIRVEKLKHRAGKLNEKLNEKKIEKIRDHDPSKK